MLTLSFISLTLSHNTNVIRGTSTVRNTPIVESGIIHNIVYLYLPAANTYIRSTLGVKFKGCKISTLTSDNRIV